MELGGKCPVIVDPENADYPLIARRILWGRTQNGGQICVGPEYILIPSTASSDPTSPQARLIEALKATYKEFYPDGAQASDSLGRIVSTESTERVRSYLDPFRGSDPKRGQIVVGGGVDISDKFIEPSVVCDVPTDSKDIIMHEEVFGPVLCIVPVKTVQEAIEYVNARYALSLISFASY